MNTTFGSLVKKYRIEKNMTQEELAREMGYKSTSSVNRIEISNEIPTMRVIHKFAQALGIDGEELLKPLDNAPLDKWHRYLKKIEEDSLFEDLDIETEKLYTRDLKDYPNPFLTKNNDDSVDNNNNNIEKPKDEFDDIIDNEPYFYFLMKRLTKEHKKDVLKLITQYHKEDALKNL